MVETSLPVITEFFGQFTYFFIIALSKTFHKNFSFETSNPQFYVLRFDDSGFGLNDISKNNLRYFLLAKKPCFHAERVILVA